MYKISFETDSREEFENYLRRLLPETEMSTTAADHGTHSTNDIIAQNKEKEQGYYEQLSLVSPDAGLSEDEILARRGLRVTDGKSGSTNVLGCKKKSSRMYEFVGADDYGYSVDVILDAYPDGGEERWNGMLFMDVCVFVHTYRHEVGFDRRYLVNHLSKRVTSSIKITPPEVVEMITGQPGEACLKLYNSGLSHKLRNILPRKEEIA